jgi:hypothetical protein
VQIDNSFQRLYVCVDLPLSARSQVAAADSRRIAGFFLADSPRTVRMQVADRRGEIFAHNCSPATIVEACFPEARPEAFSTALEQGVISSLQKSGKSTSKL